MFPGLMSSQGPRMLSQSNQGAMMYPGYAGPFTPFQEMSTNTVNWQAHSSALEEQQDKKTAPAVKKPRKRKASSVPSSVPQDAGTSKVPKKGRAKNATKYSLEEKLRLVIAVTKVQPSGGNDWKRVKQEFDSLADEDVDVTERTHTALKSQYEKLSKCSESDEEVGHLVKMINEAKQKEATEAKILTSATGPLAFHVDEEDGIDDDSDEEESSTRTMSTSTAAASTKRRTLLLEQKKAAKEKREKENAESKNVLASATALLQQLANDATPPSNEVEVVELRHSNQDLQQQVTALSNDVKDMKGSLDQLLQVLTANNNRS